MVMMVAVVPVDATVGSSAEHTQADPDSHTVPNEIYHKPLPCTTVLSKKKDPLLLLTV